MHSSQKKNQPAVIEVAASAVAEKAPVRLTHPEKLLDLESEMTKQMLADYYWAIAGQMLPHIADRPISLVRCPDGSEKPCFYQKHVNAMLPKGIGSVMVRDKKTGKPEPYITLNTPEALAGLASWAYSKSIPGERRMTTLNTPTGSSSTSTRTSH